VHTICFMHDRTFSCEKARSFSNFNFHLLKANDLRLLMLRGTRRSSSDAMPQITETKFLMSDLKCGLTEITDPIYSEDIERGAICGGTENALARYAVPTWHLRLDGKARRQVQLSVLIQSIEERSSNAGLQNDL